MSTDTDTSVADNPFRLTNARLRRLTNATIAAEITLGAVLLAVFVLVVFVDPAEALWPAASGGSLQHWITGAVLGVLFLELFGECVEDLDVELNKAAIGKPYYRTSSKRGVLLAAATALLTWPLWNQITLAWQVNDPTAAGPVAHALFLQMLPVAVLAVLPALARILITHYRIHLTRQQRKDGTTSPEADADTMTEAMPVIVR